MVITTFLTRLLSLRLYRRTVSLRLLAMESNDDYLKGLEDIDWDEDWSEIGDLCGIDSLCCIQPIFQPPINAKMIMAPANSHESSFCRSPIRTRSTVGKSTNSPGPSTAVKKKSPLSAGRFQKVVDENNLEKAIALRIPKNTSRSTNWGVSIFQEWCQEREIDTSLVNMSDMDLDRNIAHFVHEAVKRDGVTPYPPNSFYQIVVSIQRFLRENGRPDVSFFDNRSSYDTLRKSLDARMKELTSEGFGATRRQAQPITKDMESLLWERGIFSRNSANGLLNIVYFYNCKLFGLRAGDEHRALCVEQFHFGHTDDGGDYMEFIGRNNKTYQGGLCHRKVLAKDLKIFAFPELGERDIVDCFRFYLSLIPSEGPFYRRPIKSAAEPKFSQQVVGKNTLNSLVQKFCSEAGFEGFFTGHSGKVTCATELFGSMVDEQLIQHYTGHRSSESVRRYKRPGDEHFKQVSKILQPPPPKISSNENDEQLEDKKLAKDTTAENQVQKRIPLAPLEVLNNKVGTMPGTFQATNGGNITFNFNF